MNCPHCSAPNPAGATTCRECGRPLPAGRGRESDTVGPSPAEGSVPKTSDAAVASLICGILGWSFLPFVGAVLAVILGHMARTDIKRSNGRLSGDTLAVFGLLLGYASLALIAVGIILLAFLIALGIAIPIGFGVCGMCG
ncbi:MAG: DUF4190 domain-containing protein [Anaerolineae bacterium]